MGTEVATTIPQELRYDEDPAMWDAYVYSHAKGSVFHLSDMLATFAATPKHEVHASAALDTDGRIVAISPAVRVATIDGLASRLASRSIYYVEPICDPTPMGQRALERLLRTHDEEMGARTLFAEVRNIAAPAGERQPLEANGYEYLDYLNYEVNTRQDVECLWRGLGKSARNKISRSQRRGVEIINVSSHEGVDRMYPLVKESYERSFVPLASIVLFHEAFSRLPESTVQVRIAIYNGQDVAAGISLVFGGRFYAWYGGSKRLKGIAPFDCLTWEEIRWCSENDMDLYDFGGAGWPGEEYGPREFKAKFGGQLVCYGRYRRVYAKLAMKVAASSYNIVRRVFPF